ncbi:MAG: BlaI/MecI/CopY family transcriptional regulator [Syntrophomonadaceae bacterium]|nr:BlaI/MecI/CopY family transcriptional regulator [Syntrophomonadaceae bacterium]
MNNISTKISDAEWLVMKVVWHTSPLSAAGIVERLRPETDWSPKTIQTMIGRLVKKGALGVDKDTNVYLYYPLLSQEECRQGETRSFLQKVYDGSIHSLLANFVANETLSPREIQELKALLDEKSNS